MKKTSYVCGPWLSIGWKIGALLIAAGYITAFILGRGSLQRMVAYEMYEEVILAVLDLSIPVMIAGMLFAYERFDLRFIACLFIGYCLIGNGYGFPLNLATPVMLFPILMLISAIGGPWNVSIGAGLLKKLPTPWLSLLSFLIALGMAVVYFALKNFGQMLVCIGFAVFFLFSQPMPRTSVRKDPFRHSYIESSDQTLTLAGVFVALSCLVTWIFTGGFLFEGFNFGVGSLDELLSSLNSPLLSIFLLLVIFETVKLFSLKYRNLLWLALVFLFMITCSQSYGQYEYLVYVFGLLFVSAVGFSGNAPFIRCRKFDLTVMELIALIFIGLYAVCAGYRLFETTRDILAAQPHVMTKAYKIECMDEVLRSVRTLLIYLILILTVISTKTETGVNGICWFFAKLTGWVKKFAGGFQKNSGKKIQKLAFIISYICIVLTALSVLGAALFLTAGLLTSFSAAMKQLLPEYHYYILTIVCIASAASFAASAVASWFTYSFGQMAADIHSIPKMLISRTVNKAEKADDVPDR